MPTGLRENLVQVSIHACELPRDVPKAGQKAAHKAMIHDFMMSWKKFLIAEKTRQINIAERELWPKDLPWRPEDVLDMPIVMWV